jgi:hypothetical protein
MEGDKPFPCEEKAERADPRQNSKVNSEGPNGNVFVGAGFIPARVSLNFVGA